MEFSRQECWNVLPFPPSGDLPEPGTKLMSPALAGGFLTSSGKPWWCVLTDGVYRLGDVNQSNVFSRVASGLSWSEHVS